MPKCSKCSRRGLFLRINTETGLCSNCYEQYKTEQKNIEEVRKRQEDEAVVLLAEIKVLAEEVNKNTSLSLFFTGYDKVMLLLKQASEIQDKISHFDVIQGDFHRDYENNLNREQAAIRDALKRTFSYIYQLSKQKGANKKQILYYLKELKNDIATYQNRFNEENAKNADEWFPLLCEKCGIFVGDDGVSVDMDNLDGHAFEYWCAKVLEQNGFRKVQVTRGSGDQGVDIIAEKDEIRYAIQCKCYSSNLGNTPVQEVNAGKSLYDCHVGVVMTNRYFTKSAEELAKATGTLLWDRDKILQLASVR